MSLLSSILLKLALGAVLFFLVFIYMGNVGGIADNKIASLIALSIVGFFAAIFAGIMLVMQFLGGPDSPVAPLLHKIPRSYKIVTLLVIYIVIFLLMRRSIYNTA